MKCQSSGSDRQFELLSPTASLQAAPRQRSAGPHPHQTADPLGRCPLLTASSRLPGGNAAGQGAWKAPARGPQRGIHA